MDEYEEYFGVYLTDQMFRKTYVAAKKEIDDWLRAPSYKNQKGDKKDTKKYNQETANGQGIDFDIQQMQQAEN